MALDVLLLGMASSAVTYLCIPSLARFGMAIGNALEPHGDNRIVSVIMFMVVVFCGSVGILIGSFVVAWYLLSKLPERARLLVRSLLLILLMPIFVEAARWGPRTYFLRLRDPAHRAFQDRREAGMERRRRLMASGVLSAERQGDSVSVTNQWDHTVRVQVAFVSRSGQEIVQCAPGQSRTLPPAISDEEMNLRPGETRVYFLKDARPMTAARLPCGFDGFNVWGWDENGVPVYLSQKALLPGLP
jgi:hypothetical protein